MLKNNFAKFFLAIIIIIHVFILTKLIFFPFPELFIYPYLINHGLKPYSQILDQHFPGLLFSPVNFDNLGMTTPEVARIWLIIAVAITQILLNFASREILKSEKKALMVNFLYLIWQPFFEGWVLWIDSFLPLILLPAFLLLHKRRIFLTGLLLGIAIGFKQVMIPLSGLVFLSLIWQNRNLKTIGLYLLGLIVPIGLMLLYLILIGALHDFWYWTVIFNLTVFAQFGRGEMPSIAHISRVALVFGTALFAFLKMKERQVQILLIFLVGTLFGLSTRFDFVHFQPALPFAVLATVYLLKSIKKVWVLGIAYLLLAGWWLTTFYKGHIGSKVYFFDKNTLEVAEKIKNYTKKNEKIFVFGAAPHLYQMTQTLPPGDVFVFQFPWFYQVAEKKILEGIIKDKPEIIVSDRTVKIDNLSINSFAKKISGYIEENYEKIDMVDKTEILKRK